jgi:hypothetical protein
MMLKLSALLALACCTPACSRHAQTDEVPPTEVRHFNSQTNSTTTGSNRIRDDFALAIYETPPSEFDRYLVAHLLERHPELRSALTTHVAIALSAKTWTNTPDFLKLEDEVVRVKGFLPEKMGASVIKFPQFHFVSIPGRIDDEEIWLYFFGTIDGRWFFVEKQSRESSR